MNLETTFADLVARLLCGLLVWTFAASILALAYCQFNVMMKWRADRRQRRCGR